MALESDHADDRRKGVMGLAASRDGSADWALKVYDTIARTDINATVRIAALRAMVPAAGPQQVSTAIKILTSAGHVHEDVRPANGSVRWEAAKLLLAIVDAQAFEEAQRTEIVKTLLERLARDPDRNVRLTVVDALAYFAQSPVPQALIDTLEEDDFVLQRAAEQALIALTGHTHHHDPRAWRTWLEKTEDPFKDAGLTPPELQTSGGRKVRWEWPW